MTMPKTKTVEFQEGVPGLIVKFAGNASVLFNVDVWGAVTEGQFEVIGREFLAMSEIIRKARLELQFKVKLEQMKA